MIVVIDDERTFDSDEEIIYLRSADEALAWLAKWLVRDFNRLIGVPEEKISQLWLDHDLGDGDDIGIVVDFLLVIHPNFPRIESIMVHSQNPVGASRVVEDAEMLCKNVIRTGLPKLVTQ
jgi:hypothetical protein